MLRQTRPFFNRREILCLAPFLLLNSSPTKAQDKPSLQEKLEERIRKATDRLLRRSQEAASAPKQTENSPPGQTPPSQSPASPSAPWRGRLVDGVDLDVNDTGERQGTEVLLNIQHLARDHSQFWFFFGGRNGEPVNPGDVPRVRASDLYKWVSAARALDEVQQAEVAARLARDFKGNIGYFSGLATANRDFALSALVEIFPRLTDLRLTFSTRPRSGSFDPNGLPEFDKDPSKVQRVSNASLRQFLQADTATYFFSGRTLTVAGTPIDRGYTSPAYDDAMYARVMQSRAK